MCSETFAQGVVGNIFIQCSGLDLVPQVCHLHIFLKEADILQTKSMAKCVNWPEWC